LRISLGGGGTDLPSYYQRFGGAVLSAAINKYIFISMNRTFGNDYFLKYSQLERTEHINQIQHPILRQVLDRRSIAPSIEIVSVADIPSGTGLGSSGSFTVGLLHAVYAYQREHATPKELAEEAFDIEMGGLGRPVGKQDQYAAAFGGLTFLDIDRDGEVNASRVPVSDETLRDLEEHLLMFFTGYSRDADTILEEQRGRSNQDDDTVLDSLHFIKNIGLQSKVALEKGDTSTFGSLMNEHWMYKKRRSQSMSNENIDRCYRNAMDAGALGGKLVGAGGGGFLLFYAKDQDGVREAMVAEGLPEVRIMFDHEGSRILVRD
jgi:D-glycero-alpha-D-manno-heptose-7-phosphate kinase